MPGLSILQGDYRAIDREQLFESVCYCDGDEFEVVVETTSTLVATTGDERYPVRRIETDEGVLVLEGHIYDSSDPTEVVAAVEADDRDALTERIATTDGDYLLCLVRNDGTVTLLTDTFARLPTYYGTVAGTTVLSRELGLFRTLARQYGTSVTLDPLGAAQQLVFEHTLGTRTLFEGVEAVPPGSVVHVDGDVSVDRLHQYDFGQTADPDRPLDEMATELSRRLVAACDRRQVEGRPTVVSLSGGLDSRVVAAGYNAAGADFTTVTFDKESGLYAEDVRIASDIAERLGVDWTEFEVADTAADRERLLAMKQGMNNVSLAYMLDFFEQLRAQYGAVTYATGDGGHRAFVDETPPRDPTSRSDLVDQLLASNARFTPGEAAALTGIDEQSIRDSIHERFEAYPETDLAAQYDHFMFRERGINFIQHGEDRNRYFCWSVSPFYAPSVFRYAIQCPPSHKENRQLFAAVLGELSPDLLAFDYANVGAPLGTLEFRLKEYLIGQLMKHKTLKDAVARVFKDDSDATDEIGERIRDRLDGADVEPLVDDEIAAVAADAGSYRPYGLNTLLTLTMLADDLQTTTVGTEQPPSTH